MLAVFQSMGSVPVAYRIVDRSMTVVLLKQMHILSIGNWMNTVRARRFISVEFYSISMTMDSLNCSSMSFHVESLSHWW